ncbi:MAG: GreA/GreB family elongation factor [Chloroflexota bacterium]
MDKKVYLTEPVRAELEEELTNIDQVEKPRVNRLLASMGAEIEPEDRADEHLEEQLDRLERREIEIKETLAVAELVRPPASHETVEIGSTVTVDEGGNRASYTIVGSVGADPQRGWITIESPLGAGLLGKRVGETICVDAPAGELAVKVVAVR